MDPYLSPGDLAQFAKVTDKLVAYKRDEMTKRQAFFNGILIALGVYQLQELLFKSKEKSAVQADAANFSKDFRLIVEDSDIGASKLVSGASFGRHKSEKIASIL